MRVPFTKPYRALPEFDGVSLEQCERVLDRVRDDTPNLYGVRTILAFSAAALWLAAVTATLLASGSDPLRVVISPAADPFRFGLLVIGPVLAASLADWLIRDQLLWRAMLREVGRVRCRKCRQSLLGLPVESRAIGAPDPADAQVRCPECGRVWKLLDIGLSVRDLIPFEQRDVRPDFATPRRPPKLIWDRDE